MNSHVYWHWPTFFMYILMGVLLACACNANNRYFLRAGVRYKLFNRRFIGVFIGLLYFQGDVAVRQKKTLA